MTASSRKPVNVASVPQRSPFRYAGGKTWLVPQLRRWIGCQPDKPTSLLEPFCGGGIISLTAAMEDLVDHVTMVELDDDVAAVWQTALCDDCEWLSRRILDFELTIDNVRDEVEDASSSTRQRAFATILRNRTLHGGILAKGASFVKHGENGKGIASRWYPTTLVRRLREISGHRDKITFIHGDGLEILKGHCRRTRELVFIDPPYTASTKKAGSRLYTHSELDHERLFDLASRHAGEILMTYDDDPQVKHLAETRGFETKLIPMQSRRLNTMMELLIGRDLGWADAVTCEDAQLRLF